MKQFLLTILMVFGFAGAFAQTDSLRHEVLLNTSKGDIRIVLYNETPVHTENFIKNVRSGYYDGVLFHRVISNFMIQTGDSASRHAMPGQMLGETDEAYSLPAEIRFPQLYHKRGAVAAARESDNVNPERRSSMAQFYIVWGNRFSDASFEVAQQKLDQRTGGQVQLTPEIRQTYRTLGGTPHLDGQYTVFGEVIEGLDIVDQIQGVETDDNDRPLEDVKIIKATVIR